MYVAATNLTYVGCHMQDPQQLANLSPQQQQALMQRMQQEVQQQQMTDTIQQVTEKCVKKCAGTSGTTLDKREQSCMSLCMDRYIDTMTEVQKALMSRQER
ncbi:hypothetical protein TrLO_g4407 [Triparma laevis f. longispina]|uniref:Mitochondrial import inner membrane translocase subunit n=1 Tax=Triparma laevis f. longispina TaxID=1714387 RepID=A0A9W6ZDG7_9STRA|nr:hypothetical protein TrLO_g4407 [Triparma laevis f. longispina]